jgi:tRNA threonylcarbamoyladenosine biosynthesis protein TsaB
VPILCIETSATVSSVALDLGTNRLCRQTAQENFQAEHILALIDELLREAGLIGQDLTALAVSCGPGRFTGLRVGVAVAQGLAYAWRKKIIAIDSLAVWAQGVYRRYGCEKVVMVVDARRQAVYYERFHWDGQIMQSEGPPILLDVDKMSGFNSEWVGAGDGGVQYPLLAKKINTWYISAADQSPSAEDMLSLAIKAQRDNKAVSPEQILPNYVRQEVV